MHWLLSRLQSMIPRHRRASGRRRFYWPQLERLERRLPPAAHDVLSLAVPLSFAGGPVAKVSDTLTTPDQVNLYSVALDQGAKLIAAISGPAAG